MEEIDTYTITWEEVLREVNNVKIIPDIVNVVYNPTKTFKYKICLTPKGVWLNYRCELTRLRKSVWKGKTMTEIESDETFEGIYQALVDRINDMKVSMDNKDVSVYKFNVKYDEENTDMANVKFIEFLYNNIFTPVPSQEQQHLIHNKLNPTNPISLATVGDLYRKDGTYVWNLSNTPSGILDDPEMCEFSLFRETLFTEKGFQMLLRYQLFNDIEFDETGTHFFLNTASDLDSYKNNKKIITQHKFHQYAKQVSYSDELSEKHLKRLCKVKNNALSYLIKQQQDNIDKLKEVIQSDDFTPESIKNLIIPVKPIFPMYTVQGVGTETLMAVYLEQKNKTLPAVTKECFQHLKNKKEKIINELKKGIKSIEVEMEAITSGGSYFTPPRPFINRTHAKLWGQQALDLYDEFIQASTRFTNLRRRQMDTIHTPLLLKPEPVSTTNTTEAVTISSPQAVLRNRDRNGEKIKTRKPGWAMIQENAALAVPVAADLDDPELEDQQQLPPGPFESFESQVQRQHPDWDKNKIRAYVFKQTNERRKWEENERRRIEYMRSVVAKEKPLPTPGRVIHPPFNPEPSYSSSTKPQSKVKINTFSLDTYRALYLPSDEEVDRRQAAKDYDPEKYHPAWLFAYQPTTPLDFDPETQNPAWIIPSYKSKRKTSKLRMD